MFIDYVYEVYFFDVVGWDGYNFFYGFLIYNFELIIGCVYQLLLVYQIFEMSIFVICLFCLCLYDYYLKVIFVLYNYLNIDFDEVLYYVDGDFMSCNDIGFGVIILYFGGILYGLYLGVYECSIGKIEMEELVVMIDIFKFL